MTILKAGGKTAETTKNELKRWFTPHDALQTIDMIGCILTGFVKKTQYNALNIKSVTKQV